MNRREFLALSTSAGIYSISEWHINQKREIARATSKQNGEALLLEWARENRGVQTTAYLEFKKTSESRWLDTENGNEGKLSFSHILNQLENQNLPEAKRLTLYRVGKSEDGWKIDEYEEYKARVRPGATLQEQFVQGAWLGYLPRLEDITSSSWSRSEILSNIYTHTLAQNLIIENKIFTPFGSFTLDVQENRDPWTTYIETLARCEQLTKTIANEYPTIGQKLLNQLNGANRIEKTVSTLYEQIVEITNKENADANIVKFLTEQLDWLIAASARARAEFTQQYVNTFETIDRLMQEEDTVPYTEMYKRVQEAYDAVNIKITYNLRPELLKSV